MSINDCKQVILSSSEYTLPEPDISILRQGKKKPPKFPIEIFDDELRSWISNTAQGAGAPQDYVIGSLLAVSTALIGNSRRISPWQGWEETAVSWIALVGGPSSGKSPGIDPVFKVLHTIENEMDKDYEEKLKEFEKNKIISKLEREKWETAARAAIKKDSCPPDMPSNAIEPAEITKPRIICNDSSIEKLTLLLSNYPKGLLFYRDELAGWLGGFGKYNGCQASDRAFWLEAFGGRPYIIDRVKHKSPIKIANLLISILGGIQPDKLNSLLNGQDDGLTARFLWF